MSKKFNQPEFKKFLNKVFHAKLEDGSSCKLTLKEVTDVKETEMTRSFSLLFHGPKEKFLEQKTYKLGNNEYGEKQIFIVPVGESENAFHYQAVFNFLKK
ncbi:MAG: hypothetical protein PHH77_06905 [Victivallaceae bacterium]|nr:hypothetical protein [Victivallaceae bacterium]